MTSLDGLQKKLYKVIEGAGLSRISEELINAARPTILIELVNLPDSEISIGDSKIGGNPDLPVDYPWPKWREKPMGFIGQFNLSSASASDLQGLLPKQGLLSFFYDLYEMPWGYDPKKLGYSRVEYFPSGTHFAQREVPDSEIRLPCSGVVLSPSLTTPVSGSQDFEKLSTKTNLSEKEIDKYWELATQIQAEYRQTNSASFHQLLGHSHNIQGDMQLEAELVTNGLYCGDQSGFKSKRRKKLEPQSAEWQLLFQLDSDDDGGFMWGDSGMLYYWIKHADLVNRRFENHWMDLQCC
jgi:uncharacterized protein YwqG